MNFNGKTTVFKNVIQREDGTEFYKFSLSISKEIEKDSKQYEYMSVECAFYGDELKKSAIENMDPNKSYNIEVLEGFISFKKFTTKDGTEVKSPVLWIGKIKILGNNDIKEVDKKILSGKTITASDLF